MESSSTALRFKKDGSSLITRSGRDASQNSQELGGFIELLQREGVRSYLEIGARHGDTFFDVMRALPMGSRGVAVDLPGGNWGTSKSQTHLRMTCDDLRQRGYEAHCIFANSQDEGTAQIVNSMGPFDAALIDGDHLYDGVKRDWHLYGHQARLIAFHDIAGDGQRQKTSQLPVEVPRLWREIRSDFPYREFIARGSKMGIGVLWVK
jgi:hypothetical protein